MMAHKKNRKTDNNHMSENESLASAEQVTAENTQSEKQPHDKQDEPGTAEQKLTEELSEANNKYLRLYAEFENYKRRVAKERVELIQTAGKDIIASLLSVMDDFDRALKAMESATEVNAIKEGMALVSHKLKNTLAQKGLKEMDAIGKPFDAELQEAITSIPAPSDDQKGIVIDEIEKGYYLHDNVLRHAKVVVGN